MKAKPATMKRNAKIEFTCDREVQLGAYALQPGDQMSAVADGFGKFDLYCDWAYGSLGHYSAKAINELAGRKVVEG